MCKDLISVILCCKHLNNVHANTISSIKSQTYNNIELIISEGIGNNQIVRNKGFKKSKGKYVFFCDEDIILDKTCISSLYTSIISGRFSFSYCNYQRSKPFMDIQYGKPFNVEALKKMNYISTMSLIKRESFPYFDEELTRLQDWSLYLTIVEQGGVGIWCNKVLFLAIYNEDSISLRGIDDWNNSVCIVKRKHNLKS